MFSSLLSLLKNNKFLCYGKKVMNLLKRDYDNGYFMVIKYVCYCVN